MGKMHGVKERKEQTGSFVRNGAGGRNNNGNGKDWRKKHKKSQAYLKGAQPKTAPEIPRDPSLDPPKPVQPPRWEDRYYY